MVHKRYQLVKKSKAFDERELYKVVGHNCRVVRDINGLTRTDVMKRVWAYDNNQQFNNRICELENGVKKLDIPTLYKICTELDCSADFILGLSDEVERENLEGKIAGRIFQSIRGAVLEASEELCISVSKSIRHLPPYQGEMLRTNAQSVVSIIEQLMHDLAFRGQYAELIDAVMELKTNVISFDRYTSRQLRQVELSMNMLLDGEDDELSSHKLNKTFVPTKSEKIG